MECNCPAPTALTPITAVTCGVDLRQVQRIAYQRKTGTSFDQGAGTPRNIATLADWQALIAAADDDKIVVSPLIGGDPTIEPGEAITTGGGDNSTLNGVEEVEGENPSSFSCIFKSLPASIQKEMRQLNCEKNLKVYLILQGGLIASKEIAANNNDGLAIQSIFTSDRGNNGFGTKDFVNHSFQLPAGWSEDLVVTTPAFDPLTEI